MANTQAKIQNRFGGKFAANITAQRPLIRAKVAGFLPQPEARRYAVIANPVEHRMAQKAFGKAQGAFQGGAR